VTDLVYELIDAGLLIEITNDEKGEESRFMPAMDIQSMTLGTLIDRLESRGQWKIDLDVSELMTDEWSKAIEMRSNYLKDARSILLQDL
jgi:membrane protein